MAKIHVSGVRSGGSCDRRIDAGRLPRNNHRCRGLRVPGAESFPGGWVRLTLDNHGKDDHHALLMQPRPDKTHANLDGALKQADLALLMSVASAIGDPGSVAAGGKSTAIMNLPPGSSTLACVIPGPDGMPHYLMGMQTPDERNDRARRKTGGPGLQRPGGVG